MEDVRRPWELPEDCGSVGVRKIRSATPFGEWEASLMSYDARGIPPNRSGTGIGTAICADAYCALDDTATGQNERHIATVRLAGTDWRATMYGQYYDWTCIPIPRMRTRSTSGPAHTLAARRTGALPETTRCNSRSAPKALR